MRDKVEEGEHKERVKNAMMKHRLIVFYFVRLLPHKWRQTKFD